MTTLIYPKQKLSINNKWLLNLALWLAVILFCLISTPITWAKGYSNTCTKTTKAARKACHFDIKDDFWINIGHCFNNSNRRELPGCIRQARTQHREDRSLCKAQKEARNEICDALGGVAYKPEIDPSQFLSPAEIKANPNIYFPLTPGLVKTFKSGDETIVFTVTKETVEILGITCIVVRDIVTENGEVIEDTDDWYAQDKDGNVWYFGEISKSFEDGELNNLDGSWKAGVDNALPGIIMKSSPILGDIYRQEFALGEAEDMAEILSISETSEVTPAADCSETCIVTRDFLPTEPDVEELKYYAPSIGNILTIDQETGERVELIDLVLP